MKIEVTQQHIDKGLRASCSLDPVALALAGVGFKQPWVSPDHIAWRRDNKDYSVPTPPAVLDFLKLWDNGGTLFPFTFDLPEGFC
jgi:hypothetical protein